MNTDHGTVADATMRCSIFIASSTINGVPADTSSPSGNQHLEHFPGHGGHQPAFVVCTGGARFNPFPSVGASVEVNPPDIADLGNVSQVGFSVFQPDSKSSSIVLNVSVAFEGVRIALLGEGHLNRTVVRCKVCCIRGTSLERVERARRTVFR